MSAKLVSAMIGLVLFGLLELSRYELRDQRDRLDALAPRLRSLNFHCMSERFRLADIVRDSRSDRAWLRNVAAYEFVRLARDDWQAVNVCLPEDMQIMRKSYCGSSSQQTRQLMDTTTADDRICFAAAAASVNLILAATR